MPFLKIVRREAMSTVAEPVSLEKLEAAVAEMRNDENGFDRKTWVLVGHVNNSPNQIDLVDYDTSADATVEGFCSKLEDDQVMYGLLRLSTTIDMSSTVRFIYVHWIGENVPFVKKGRFGVVQGSVREHFQPFHVVVETGNKEDLIEEELIKMLEDSSMTRSKVISVDQAMKMQQRGFTQHEYKRKEQSTFRSVAPDALTVEVTSELQEAIGEVKNDQSTTKWVLAGYEDADVKKPLTLAAKGEGDIEELKEALKDEEVMYGLFRTSDTYDEIETVKFVYIHWIGEKVKPMSKGKVSAHAGPVEKIFSPAHVGLSFTSRWDIDPEIIRDKVSASSGSKSWIKNGAPEYFAPSPLGGSTVNVNSVPSVPSTPEVSRRANAPGGAVANPPPPTTPKPKIKVMKIKARA